MYHLQKNRRISAQNEPCLQTLLLAGALDCKAESSTGQRQCNSLQCSPVHGSGPGPTSPTQTDKERNNNKRTHTTTNRHRESKQTKDTAEKRGGENPQKDRNDMAAPVNDKANSTRRQWTLAPEQQDRSQESPTLARGRATNHTHIQKQVRAKRQGERRQSSGGRTKHRHRDTQHRGRRRRGQEAATERGRNGTREPERVLKRLTERPMGVLEHQR